MEKLFQKIVVILEKNGNISNEDREVYLFALHTAMIYLINIVCSIVIGILMGMPLDCIIFLIAFILLRQEAGGYHAPGYKTCFLFSCIVLVLALLWVKLKVPFQTWITVGLMLLASGVIYVNAPLESENKVLGSEQKAKIKIQARQILAIEMIAGILLLFVDVRAAYAVCSAIIWCGLGCVLWLLQNWMRGKHIN